MSRQGANRGPEVVRSEHFPPRFFVTGTDTGVGKTVVCALLAAALKACYWKPVQCGLDGGGDTETVRALSGIARDCCFPETHRLAAPLSPHAAAASEGIRISLDDFTLPACRGPLIVEGAGGVMVPLNDKHFMLDLMLSLKLPVLLVARSTLGTINHTLLSINACRSQGLEIFGVIMNGPRNEKNRTAVEHFCQVPVLLELEPFAPVDHQQIQSLVRHFFEGK